MDLSSIRPYSFELRYAEGEIPSDSDTSSSDEEFDGNDDDSRLGGKDWCECGNCQSMQTAKECICCQEWDLLHSRLEDVDCICDHHGFEAVCLNTEVLETAYIAFMSYKNIGGRAPDVLSNV